MKTAFYPATATARQLADGTAAAVECEFWYASGEVAPAAPSGSSPVSPWVEDVLDLPSGSPLWVSDRELPGGDWSAPRRIGNVP